MATINPSGSWVARGVHKAEWANITGSGDTVNGFVGPGLSDKSIQVKGTFGSATVTIQGSNGTATEYVTLTDPQGNALTFTTDKIEQILENPLRIRPVASGATGGTDVTVIMISKGG